MNYATPFSLTSLDRQIWQAFDPDQPVSEPRRASWMPWIGGTRANTTIDEASFVMRLNDLARERRGEHQRSDTTAVLNALRCGVDVDDLLDRAPGLQVDRLLAAYIALDRLRFRAESAWMEIVDAGTADALHQRGCEAGKLVPSLIGQLHAVASERPDELAGTIAMMATSVRAATSCVLAIEQALHESVGDQEGRARLGRLLYDPEAPGATSRPDFVPRRVGTLVPTRVAALLGERVDVTSSPPGSGTGQ
jgi:hypothetical protein